MRKLLLGVTLIIVMSMLAACMSIPIGDSTLKISSDGIDFVPNDKGETNQEDDAETAVDENAAEDVAAAENDMTNENGVENDVETSDLTNQKIDENCAPQDHSDITDSIQGDFYIPQCAEIVEVKKNEGSVTGVLMLEDIDWDEVYGTYIDVLGDQVSSESKEVQSEKGNIKAVFSNNTSANIKLEQKDTAVKIWFNHKEN